ncbi:MAG TPA: hypothetical protein VEB43_04695 [Anaeromyxobacter sp.]|nr:hypothetical protein [Anaeromyxobacter sp.]
MKNRGAILAALGAVLAAGCDSIPKNALLSCEQDVQVLPAQTDLLFVVDDSRSMQEEQENLRQNLAAFVAELAASPVPNDFRIGVTTTDVHNTFGMASFFPTDVAPFDQFPYAVPFAQGTILAIDPGALADDALRGKPVYDQVNGYVVPGARRFLGATPADVDAFETNVLVGTYGSGKEEPLRATELALGARIDDGTNAGFLRPGARLGVVMLTDEDDCSERAAIGAPLAAINNDQCHDATIKANGLLRPEDFATFLDGPIAGEERRPVVAVIAGFDPQSGAPTGCATSYDAPTRLDSLLDLLGEERAFRGSICDASFGPSLRRIADLLVPQTVPIDGAPPDARMLVVAVQRRDSTIDRCPVAEAGTPEAAQAAAVYAPPREGPATLTFQGPCRLRSGDRVELRVACAR